MPFYYSERSAGICIVLGTKKSSTDCREYASGFLELAALHCQQLVRFTTKDYSDRLLGFTFEVAEEVRHGDDLDRFDLPDRKQVIVTTDEPMDSCRHRTGKNLHAIWVSQYRDRDGFCSNSIDERKDIFFNEAENLRTRMLELRIGQHPNIFIEYLGRDDWAKTTTLPGWNKLGGRTGEQQS